MRVAARAGTRPQLTPTIMARTTENTIDAPVDARIDTHVEQGKKRNQPSQNTNGSPCPHKAGGRTRSGQDHALDDQQPHDPVTRRAEREAEAQFRCARDAAREQDAGHVETRDDQDESDEREEQAHKAIRNRADDNRNNARGGNPETVTAIGIGVLALEITGDTRHLGSGLIDRDAVLEASDPHQPLPASQPDAPKVIAVRVRRHRDPDALLID